MIGPPKILSHSVQAGLLLVVALCGVLGCEAGEEDDVALVSIGATARGVEATQQVEAVEEIAARVNDAEIDLREVDLQVERISSLYRQNQRVFDESRRAQKRRQVVERLIDEELIRGHLRQEAIALEAEEVEEHLERYVSRRFGSPSAFHRYLATEGVELTEVRRQVHDDLALRRLLVPQEEQVEEAELLAAYDRIARGRPAAERVRVVVVGLSLVSDGDDGERDRVRQELEEALDGVSDRSDLEELSASLQATLETRWVERFRASPYATKVLFGVESTGLMPLVETPVGFEIYWVKERREAGVRAFDEVEDLLRERVLRARVERGRRDLLEHLRRDALIEVHLPEGASHGSP